MKLVWDGNAKDFYIGLDDSADKLVIGEGSTVGTNSILTITDDAVTIGDGATEDTYLNFDGNAQDYRIGIDDGTDILEVGVGTAHGTTTALKIDSSAQVTVGVKLIMPDVTAGKILVGDGTSYEEVAVSGDIGLASDGNSTIQANSVEGTHIALGSDASGDVMYNNGTNYVRLGKGSDDEVLTLASGVPSWAAAPGAGSVSIGKALAFAIAL